MDANTVLPGIALFPVESSQLSAAGYDEKSRTLAVQFKDNPTRTYRYHDVPAAVWDGFGKAKSKGAYFYSAVKPVFGFTRVEADGEVSKVAEAPKQRGESEEPQPSAAE